MHIHFIAIGGSVMHQLAIALAKKGYTITGSDDEIFEPASTNLKNAVILTGEGWHPENINADIDAVILGMHAKQDNPELIKAIELGVKIYSFPEYIYEESTNKKRVAVGGSHGKTTTTAMIMHVLKHAKKEFDYLVGARLEGFEQSVKISNADLIICEADEYPASVIEKRPKFHFLFPHIAVITGIAWDHINVFPTFDFYLEQFVIFIKNKIERNGVLIYNETDATLNNLVLQNRRDDIKYIPYSLPDYFIQNGATSIEIENEKINLKVFGNHNLLNLTAAYHVCRELNISVHIFAEAIAAFTGASKRFELLDESKDGNIYRDFAHAPSKVLASVNAMKQQFPNRKLIAVLELHTFSSLNEKFMNEYNGALENADEAIVFYSNHALELKRMPLLNPEKVKEGFGKTNLEVITSREALEKRLIDFEKANTNFLFMSSGNYEGMDILGVIKR